uniref:Uncharacterized protein n=1 Tax=Anguilla anguilla TaxID=7936 RepID=A0A0E9UN16_ANGAN
MLLDMSLEKTSVHLVARVGVGNGMGPHPLPMLPVTFRQILG